MFVLERSRRTQRHGRRSPKRRAVGILRIAFHLEHANLLLLGLALDQRRHDARTRLRDVKSLCRFRRFHQTLVLVSPHDEIQPIRQIPLRYRILRVRGAILMNQHDVKPRTRRRFLRLARSMPHHGVLDVEHLMQSIIPDVPQSIQRHLGRTLTHQHRFQIHRPHGPSAQRVLTEIVDQPRRRQDVHGAQVPFARRVVVISMDSEHR